MKTCYLAGPINACSDSEANDWRAEVKDKLAGLYEFIDPMRHDYRGRELEPGVAEEIVGNDLQDIYSSDVIFANCPKPSVGTSMEIYHSFEMLKKPVVVIAPMPISPWLKRFSTVQYTNLMAGITYLRTIAKR
jgi:hypothetical protein